VANPDIKPIIYLDMADNNGFTAVPTKGNKKKAAGEKADVKKEALARITADVDKILQEAIPNASFIEKNDISLYYRTNINELISTIQKAAEAAKKTTIVAEADGYLQTMIKSNKEIAGVASTLRAKVAANMEKHKARQAEVARMNARYRARELDEIQRKEYNLERLYKLLYDLYDYYTNPLSDKRRDTFTERETLTYIQTQSSKLGINIKPVVYATTQTDVVKYLTELRKDLDTIYNNLSEEKRKVIGEQRGVGVRSNLNEAVLSVDHLINTIKQVQKRAAAERAAAEKAAEERAAAAAAAEEARRAKEEEDYKRILEEDARRRAEESRRYREQQRAQEQSRTAAPPPVIPHMNAYVTLGIPPGANNKTIKTAYKKLALVHHPDKGGDPEKFKIIQNAYNRLKNTHGGANYKTRKTRGLRKMTRKRND
jgi:hypothetical protein